MENTAIRHIIETRSWVILYYVLRLRYISITTTPPPPPRSIRLLRQVRDVHARVTDLSSSRWWAGVDDAPCVWPLALPVAGGHRRTPTSLHPLCGLQQELAEQHTTAGVIPPHYQRALLRGDVTTVPESVHDLLENVHGIGHVEDLVEVRVEEADLEIFEQALCLSFAPSARTLAWQLASETSDCNTKPGKKPGRVRQLFLGWDERYMLNHRSGQYANGKC